MVFHKKKGAHNRREQAVWKFGREKAAGILLYPEKFMQEIQEEIQESNENYLTGKTFLHIIGVMFSRLLLLGIGSKHYLFNFSDVLDWKKE